jgi:hypothetical protein
MAEISDAELAELRGAHRLLDAVIKNPETKDDAARILKKLNPKAAVPEYDLKVAVGKALQQRDERIAKLEKMITDEKVDAKFNRDLDAAAARHGITEEARPKVLKLMQDRNIYDPEAATLLFLNQNPPAEIATSSGWASAAMFDEPKGGTEWGEWFQDPAGMRDKEIGKFFSETRSGKNSPL